MVNRQVCIRVCNNWIIGGCQSRKGGCETKYDECKGPSLGNTVDPERREEEWSRCDEDYIWFPDPVWTEDAVELGEFFLS